MRDNLAVVIMAGGAGTRFWPLSTNARPKQFLALTGSRTLIQMSFDRVKGLVNPERVFVLTSSLYTDLVAQQLPEIPRENIVGEPCRRDTAAAVALATLLVEERYPGSTMVVLTADHVIEPVEEFHRALLEAAQNCGNRVLYTLGIKPTYPATQFGYLEMEEAVEAGELEHYSLRKFKEKPDLETAQGFLDSGSYYWNSGMFVWQTADILSEFQDHLPDHLRKLRPVIGKISSSDFSEAFASLQPISVDFAILEKAQTIRAVVPKIDWDDVGGWLAAAKYLETDQQQNSTKGRVVCAESAGNTVFLEDSQEEILLLGVSDLVVVRSGGRTLVAHKDHLDSLKASLADLED